MQDGITRCEWYKGQSILHQRILDRLLNEKELEEIRDGADGFLKVRTGRSRKGKTGGEEEESAAGKAEGASQPPKSVDKNASSHLKELLGVNASGADGGIVRGAYAALAEDAIVARPGATVLVEDKLVTFTREARKERKKARQQARRETADDPTGLESNDRDELEQELARTHSTAAAAAAVPKRQKLKRLKAQDMEEMNLKQLRRALADRGVEKPDWTNKPDEARLLRDHAKQLPSVCEEAAGVAKARKPKRTTEAVDGDAAKEVDTILARLDLT